MASNRRRAAELIDLTKEEVITITDDSPSPSPPLRPQPRRGYIEVVVDFSDSEHSDHEHQQKSQSLLRPRQPVCLKRRRIDNITENPLSQPQPPPPPRAPENPLKCPICITSFHEIKQTLQSKCVVTNCGHLFCEPCLKKALLEQGRKCPKCRKLVPKRTKLIEVYDVC